MLVDALTGAALIPLSGRAGDGLYALVDPEDYDAARQYVWHALRTPHTTYAARKVRRPDGTWTTQRLHRFLSPDAPDMIDHANGDGLDNRRCNLRHATRSENGRNARRRSNNTTGYIGVTWHTGHGKFQAQAQHHGRQHHIGYYTTAEAAARARDAYVRQHYGEFAALNFDD